MSRICPFLAACHVTTLAHAVPIYCLGDGESLQMSLPPCSFASTLHAGDRLVLLKVRHLMSTLYLKTLRPLIISLHQNAVRTPQLTEVHEAPSTGNYPWVSALLSHPPPAPPAASVQPPCSSLRIQ